MRVLDFSGVNMTHSKGHRTGFTLVELLVAMVIFGVIAGGIMNVLISSQRASGDQAQRIDLQQNMRAANTILPADLRSLDAADGDIKAMAANSITIRAIRQLGFICVLPVTGGPLNAVPIVVRSPLYSAQRPFAPNDSIWVWYEGDVATRNDDGWIAGKITATVAAACADGSAGVNLTSSLTIAAPKSNVAKVLPVGSPVWGWETVTYATALAADGRYYLNLTNSNGTQPLLGPLPNINGVTLTYYDAAGAVTAIPTAVRQIDLVMVGQTGNRISRSSTSAYATDSLRTRITLRNNPRF